jgi:FMN-dependent NADH-azoreductase
MPMWNFSMPAIMKAWLDQVVIPGVTDISIAWADGQHGHGEDEAKEHKDIATETAQDIADEISEMAMPVEAEPQA